MKEKKKELIRFIIFVVIGYFLFKYSFKRAITSSIITIHIMSFSDYLGFDIKNKFYAELMCAFIAGILCPFLLN